MSRYGPALFFVSVLCLSIPAKIVVENKVDLGPQAPYLEFFAWASVWVMALAFACNTFLSSPRAVLVQRLMFGCALFAFLSQIVTPLTMPHLETGTESPTQPLSQILMDTVLLLGCFMAVRKFETRLLQTLGLTFGIAIVPMELFGVYQNFESTPAHVSNFETPEPTTAFPGNVYHFVFDAYPGNWWPSIVRELDCTEDFRDFTYFKYARSNYIATVMSLPSFTTGRLFDGETQSLKSWIGETFEATTLVKARELGFSTSAYSIRGASGNPLAHFNDVTHPVTPALIADVWLLRIVPTFLRSTVFAHGSGAFSQYAFLFNGLPAGDTRSYRSLQQFERLELHESKRRQRGEFVFAHVYPPHGPYQLMRDGTYNSRRSSFNEQTFLATNLMSRFLEQLRQSGKYENSLVIFQSDHGTSKSIPDWVKGGEPKRRISVRVDKWIEEHDAGGRTAEYLDGRTRPLLLIKPPGVRHERTIQIDRIAQLVDIDRLIREILQGSLERDLAEVTRSMMDRERVVIANGYFQKNAPDGSRVTIGTNHPRAMMSRYEVDDRSNWEILEAMDVRWSEEPVD